MTVRKKICILGDFAVGKTSLVRRYVFDAFSDAYRATLGVNIYKYSDRVAVDEADGVLIFESHDASDAPPDVEVSLVIWDIEGGDVRHTPTESYIHGAAGALVVADLTRPETLQTMQGHATRFTRLRPGRPVAYAFNKLDAAVAVDRAELEALARERGIAAATTSAATGESVRALFRALSRGILRVGA